MASVTADFGPSSVLIQGQNAPLREHPVPLPSGRESILDKTAKGYIKNSVSYNLIKSKFSRLISNRIAIISGSYRKKGGKT